MVAPEVRPYREPGTGRVLFAREGLRITEEREGTRVLRIESELVRQGIPLPVGGSEDSEILGEQGGVKVWYDRSLGSWIITRERPDHATGEGRTDTIFLDDDGNVEIREGYEAAAGDRRLWSRVLFVINLILIAGAIAGLTFLLFYGDRLGLRPLK